MPSWEALALLAAHTCLPSCPTLVCPLTTVRMLSSNLLQEKPQSVKPSLCEPDPNNWGSPESYRTNLKQKKPALTNAKVIISPLSLCSMALSCTISKSCCKNKNSLPNLTRVSCIPVPLSNIVSYPLSVCISTSHMWKCCLNHFMLAASASTENLSISCTLVFILYF